MRRFRPLLIALSSALMSAAVMASPLYRWVDAQGKVHYGDQPPPQQQDAEQVELKYLGKGKPSPPPESAAQERGAGADPVLELLEPDSSLLLKPSPQRCAAARQRLQVYTKARRLENTDEYGQRRIISDAERQKYIAGAREDVQRACAGQ